LNRIETRSTASDEELMHRVREGEVSLLSVLFERHQQKLFRYCWRMTGDSQLSEDLVQEVFLRMLRHRESFNGDGAFGAWMYSIARNAGRDGWRKRRRETPIDERMALPGGIEGVERSEESARLHRALLELPDDKRELLVMSRFLGMSHAEISAALGCDEGTSRARLHRALNGLREIMLAGSARKRTIV
jgi:RNA polymerase sigma-70 factor (ECF subfamily)